MANRSPFSRRPRAGGNGAAGSGAPGPKRLQVGLRVMSWSKFQLEVVRGVQAYAARHPAWRLFVDGAPHAASPIHAGSWTWDGVITSDLTKKAMWRALARDGRTKLVSVTAAPPRGLEL